MVDAARRGIELARGDVELPERPTIIIFILWIGIDLLLALLLALRTRAGRYWTQAILAIHVFYLAHELCLHSPDLWLAMGVMGRVRILATVFLDGAFVTYLFGRDARNHLQEGP